MATGFYLGLAVWPRHTEFMQIHLNQGACPAGTACCQGSRGKPVYPLRGLALLPAGLSASLRAPLAFASPVPPMPAASAPRAALRASRLACCCHRHGFAVAMAWKTFKSAPSQPVRPAQTTPPFVCPFSLYRDHSQVKSGAPAACKGALRRVLTRSVLACGSAPLRLPLPPLHPASPWLNPSQGRRNSRKTAARASRTPASAGAESRGSRIFESGSF